jgi:Cyclin M transmembrane N-terminal domain
MVCRLNAWFDGKVFWVKAFFFEPDIFTHILFEKGLDETNLHVLIESGSEAEKANAQKVLRLLDRGKHWVLVTLLLSNVIVNETLPIILDSVFGGGWQAIVISTALIVIFGE